MDYQTAMQLSAKGTAIRETDSNGIKRSIIRYSDGSGFTLVSVNGKVDYFLSRPAQGYELNGHLDWNPSE